MVLVVLKLLLLRLLSPRRLVSNVMMTSKSSTMDLKAGDSPVSVANKSRACASVAVTSISSTVIVMDSVQLKMFIISLDFLLNFLPF